MTGRPGRSPIGIRTGGRGPRATRERRCFLDLVDLDYERADRADWTLSVETTCLNRDIPARLPYGGGHPKMTFGGGGGAGRRRVLPDRADGDPAPRVRRRRHVGA